MGMEYQEMDVIHKKYLSFKNEYEIAINYFGSKLTKQDSKIYNYLGITLLPQAGVAIGMARSSSSTLRLLAPGNPYLLEIAGVITAVVLTATLVYELFGPVITKVALTKAGEIPEQKNK